nr:uncharacterized protein LOC122593030 isoform X2 [Erigeron canadensis]
MVEDNMGLQSGALSKGKGKGPCRNLNLEAEFAKRGRLSIDFDTRNLKTWQAMGLNYSMYKSLIGTLVRHIPQTYDCWDHVPTRFKLDHFIHIPNPEDPIKQGFKLCVDRDCSVSALKEPVQEFPSWNKLFPRGYVAGGLESFVGVLPEGGLGQEVGDKQHEQGQARSCGDPWS